jgi:hypothetical protein
MTKTELTLLNAPVMKDSRCFEASTSLGRVLFIPDSTGYEVKWTIPGLPGDDAPAIMFNCHRRGTLEEAVETMNAVLQRIAARSMAPHNEIAAACYFNVNRMLSMQDQGRLHCEQRRMHQKQAGDTLLVTGEQFEMSLTYRDPKPV